MRFQSFKTKKGASIVEFAMVVPVLLLFIMSMLEIGWYLHIKQSAAIAARDGARIISTNAGSELDAETAAENYLSLASIKNPTVVAVDASAGDDVTMTVTIPYSDNSLVGDPFGFFSSVVDVEVTVTMRKEYPPDPP